MEDGEECVLTDIILLMLKWCADSWDFHCQVRTAHVNWGIAFKAEIVAELGSGFRDWVPTWGG